MDRGLDAGDLELLLHITRRHLSNLRTEVVRTDSFTVRQELKAEEVAVKRLIDVFEGELAAETAAAAAPARA